jgi:hypothetical protein
MQPVKAGAGWQVCGGEVHTRTPAPICADHYERLYESIPNFRVDEIVVRKYVPQPKSDAPKYVYFARMGDRVKIGHSINPEARVKGMSLGDQAQVIYTCSGGPFLEKELHRLFAARRISGEWFQWCSEIETWIEDHKEADLTGNGVKHTMVTVGGLHLEATAESPAEAETLAGLTHERGNS